ncbi:MAG: hypothetical protein GTO03_11080 [Planctomycetales bacterium]|nr:hypothetical protein [Planctomycetales bacterium]
MSDRLPIIILGGSDQRPSTVPQQLASTDMLTGFKGATPLPWGRTLAAELIRRVQATKRFLDPVLIGPRQVYQDSLDAQVVHAQGSLVVTIRTAMEVIAQQCDPAQPVAIMACDILPSSAELLEVLENDYQPHRQAMFWWQMVQATPAELGASHWKPVYPIRPTAEQQPLTLYPGHLVIFRPQALRVGLASSMLELAYRYRNRDIRRRYLPLVFRSLFRLLAEDLRNLGRLQLPILTIALPVRGLWGYYCLRRQRLTIRQVETNISQLLLHRHYHHAADGRPVVVSVNRVLSLAKDIDTQAELAEAVAAGPAP